MEDLRKEQLEALKVMLDYIPKLRKGMETVAKELNGVRLADTNEYLKKVIDGLNWVIEVYNGTSSLINEKANNLDKAAVNKACIDFGEAYKNGDSTAQAELLTGSLAAFITDFEHAANAVIA